MAFTPGQILTADDLNRLVTGLWTGKLAADIASGSVVASQYTSCAPSTQVESSGDFTVTWTGDAFAVSRSGFYRITWQVGYDNTATSGNRFAGLLKNFTATTYASTSAPAAAYRLRFAKGAASSAETAVVVTWSGYLLSTDKILPLFRTTSATGVSGAVEDTSLDVMMLRAA